MTAIVKDQVDAKKRRFLTFATGGVGALAGAAVAAPFAFSWFPSRKARAAGAAIKVDVSLIEPGQLVTYEWRGKPIWVMRRTAAQIAQLEKNSGVLADPDSKSAKQPDYVKGAARSIKPDILVVEGVCTHLGCSPQLRATPGAESGLGADWPGGFYCPCHNSRFDLSARVFAGAPAPTNLPVPKHMFVSDTSLLIGEDSKGA
jgi:ubiquinol-cytochrome c reductase iron-sulfur subunit